MALSSWREAVEPSWEARGDTAVVGEGGIESGTCAGSAKGVRTFRCVRRGLAAAGSAHARAPITAGMTGAYMVRASGLTYKAVAVGQEEWQWKRDVAPAVCKKEA